VEEDGVYRVVYVGKVGLQRMRRLGVSSLEQLNAAINADNHVFYQTVRSCCSNLSDIGQTAMRTVEDPSYTGQMEAELITSDGRRRGFVVSCLETARAA